MKEPVGKALDDLETESEQAQSSYSVIALFHVVLITLGWVLNTLLSILIEISF